MQVKPLNKDLLLSIGRKCEQAKIRLNLNHCQWTTLSAEIRIICPNVELAERVFGWFYSFSGKKYSCNSNEHSLFNNGQLIALTAQTEIKILDLIVTQYTPIFKKGVCHA